MELGMSLASASILPAAEAGRHLVRRARAARAAELATLSLGDSHVVGGAAYLQNTPALGRVLAEWSGRPAGCLFLLPMWPPVLVAEQVGTLAALHDATFIVQTGLGGSPQQFAALGASPGRRITVFEESVRIVQALIRGEVVDSELFGFADVSIGLVPDQPIEWWIGTMNPAGLRRAARFGAAWYASPGALAADLAPLDELYREACEDEGTVARLMLRRDALVLHDGDRARELGRTAVASGYRGLGLEQLIVGSPVEVAEQLAPFREIGVDQIVARTMAISPELDLETIECLGEVRRLIA
jgi:alkanesulfonate monooxygenase SsuD/methylene tetrahydromethanopterin reductase-like flavin-dependent oxidoreductase (luciferase family)